MAWQCGYGLARPEQAREFVEVVCNVLGQGRSGHAIPMLLETAAQETHTGRYRDPTPNGAGRGLFQMDRIAFEDVQERTREVHRYNVWRAFGFDVATVQHEWLDSSPLLAAVFCRLFYLLKPEQFPATVRGRADYWKRHYNTAAGKGTVDDYIRNVELYGV